MILISQTDGNSVWCQHYCCSLFATVRLQTSCCCNSRRCASIKLAVQCSRPITRRTTTALWNTWHMSWHLWRHYVITQLRHGVITTIIHCSCSLSLCLCLSHCLVSHCLVLCCHSCYHSHTESVVSTARRRAAGVLCTMSLRLQSVVVQYMYV